MHLDPLLGAKADAERVYKTFMNAEILDSDSTLSALHINLTKDETRKVIAEAAYNDEIGDLTLYFACHGASDTAGYFLCCKDCQSDKLAYSALALHDIFTILSDTPRKHVNFIIDACNAGGLAQDLSAIAKDPKMGAKAGISISIISLSGRTENSIEYPDGGIGTTAFLEVLNGKHDSNTNKEYLSLGDVAQVLEISHKEQSSSFWSFNLMGAQRFCKNLYALNNRKSEIFSLPTANLKLSLGLSRNSIEKLWDSFLLTGKEFNPRQIQITLELLLNEIENNDDAISMLMGLFESYLERAKQNNDAFSPVICCSIFLDLTNKISPSSKETEYLANILFDELKFILSNILTSMKDNEFFLLENGGYSNFFTLPQRVSKIAAWSLLLAYLGNRKHADNSETMTICEGILNCLSNDYHNAFTLISEKQAPDILIISGLTKKLGLIDWANSYIPYLYNSYCHYSGKIAKVSLEPELVYDLVRHRLEQEETNYKELCGRPTEALFALISHYWKEDDLDIIRYDFEGFDGLSLNAFVPDNYKDFSREIIPEGRNLGFTIGYDIFHSGE